MKVIELKSEIMNFMSMTRAVRSDGTLQAYYERLGFWMRDCGDMEVDQKMMSEWMGKLSTRGTSPQSIKAYLNAVKSFLAWLESRGIVRNPIGKIPIKNTKSGSVERLPITENEYARMLTIACARKGYMGYALRVGWATGLRMGDIAQLKWENVNLDTETINITPQKTARMKKTVEIPMTQALADLFREIKQHGTTDLYVMPSMAKDYLRFQQTEIGKRFKTVARAAGIENKSFHCLRHSFVTRHLDAGRSPVIIAAMTGHSLAEIMTYSHVSLASKRESLID